MTSDIDQLASAYIDGETTAAETAWVESSPEAMRYVDEYRKIQSLVKNVEPAESSTKERNIGAALAAFSDEFDKTVEVPLKLAPEPLKLSPGSSTPGLTTEINDAGTDNTVVPLHGRASTPTTGINGSPTVTAMSKRRNRWLAPVASAAAVVALAVTGVSLFASQDGLTTSNGDAATEVATDQGSASEQTAVATQGKANPSSGDVAEESDEASDDADSSADDAARLSDSDSEESEESAEASATSQAGSPESGPITFDSVPPEAELESLAAETTLSTDFTTSPCARSVTDPDGGERIGFLPVSVDGVDGEIIVFESEANASGVSVSLVTSECVPFSGRS